MRKFSFPHLALLSLVITLFISPLAAQKVPRRVRKSAQPSAHISKQPKSVRKTTYTPVPPATVRKSSSLPHPKNSPLKPGKISPSQIRWISSLIPEKSSNTHNALLKALPQLWGAQQRYENNALFSEFIRQYYSKNFGVFSPHLKTFFDKVSTLQNRELELQITKRISYITQNKDLLVKAALPDHPTLPEHAFRLRYLSEIGELTANNFRPEQLVLSVERRMSTHPQKDFPLRHVSGQAMFTIGKQLYPVYGYNGPLDNISQLYRFLLNGHHKNNPLTVVFDEKARSMAIYNEDKSMWLRISSHEYSSPNRLHLHLNELRTVNFVNTYGVESQERMNCNLSIPLSVPPDLPAHGTQEFLFQKLIVNPVKFWEGNDHVTIEKQSIF